jgi:hypothetical protein
MQPTQSTRVTNASSDCCPEIANADDKRNNRYATPARREAYEVCSLSWHTRCFLDFRSGGHYDEEDNQTRSLNCFACVRDNISYGLRFYLP